MKPLIIIKIFLPRRLLSVNGIHPHVIVIVDVFFKIKFFHKIVEIGTDHGKGMSTLQIVLHDQTEYSHDHHHEKAEDGQSPQHYGI